MNKLSVLDSYGLFKEIAKSFSTKYKCDIRFEISNVDKRLNTPFDIEAITFEVRMTYDNLCVKKFITLTSAIYPESKNVILIVLEDMRDKLMHAYAGK